MSLPSEPNSGSPAGYTPGLTVSPNALIRRVRRLPLKGEVVVQPGEAVAPETVVARSSIPGILRTVRAAERLGIDAGELPALCQVAPGAAVSPGQLLAECRTFFGLFHAECRSPVDGTVELISPISGHVGIRERPRPIEVTAYVSGRVAEVLEAEGVVIETRGALVQGIFGVGGERHAPIHVLPHARSLTESDLSENDSGKIIVGPCGISGAALRRAAELGVAGLVLGAMVDEDLIEYLGHDIGVAITGHEAIPFPVVLTEGFGEIRMADRTFRLLQSLEGRSASMNGATQIRAGVIRPEVVVPGEQLETIGNGGVASGGSLREGAAIRIIREPYFGLLATVTGMPAPLQRIPTGAEVRVLEAELASGERVIVPRANVELI